MPYIRGVSEALSRRMRKLGVSVHSKPINTIRGQLVAPKDKSDKLDVSSVVYKIDCRNCPQSYIGETERNLKTRINEHKRESSPVGAHMREWNHTFEKDTIKIIDKEQKWFQRGVKEAIHIAANVPTLNQDQGRHTLPSVYSSLVQSCTLSSSHGCVN